MNTAELKSKLSSLLEGIDRVADKVSEAIDAADEAVDAAGRAESEASDAAGSAENAKEYAESASEALDEIAGERDELALFLRNRESIDDASDADKSEIDGLLTKLFESVERIARDANESAGTVAMLREAIK